ncbi:MAG: hypothetical protein J0L50_01440 [Sphingomonadales bacterium]|nr:hypothetical protein [Sphingomonadales bacterium]
MKFFALKLAGVAALAAAALPGQAVAQANAEYDRAMYETLMDCATLQVIFGIASDTEEKKQESATTGAAFYSAAEALSGTKVPDLGAELKPRQTRIMGWITSKDKAATRLAKTCGAIIAVGQNVPRKN